METTESLFGTEAGEVKDYARRVDDAIQAIDKEVLDGVDKKYGGFTGTIPASPKAADLAEDRKVDTQLYRDWTAFKTRWAAKKKEVDGFFYGSDKRYNEVKTYEDEAKGWARSWKARGFNVTGGGRFDAPFDWGLLLTTVGLLSAAGFGSYYIFKHARESEAYAQMSDRHRHILSMARSLPPPSRMSSARRLSR